MVTNVPPIVHPDLPGTRIFSLPNNEGNNDGIQRALVVMEPDASIPVHTHTVDAMMVVSAGEATILPGGERVAIGDQFPFPANVPHGVLAGPKGCAFVSVNGGIVDPNPRNWNIAFT